MRLLGWRCEAMLSRYGASAADHRARAGGPTVDAGVTGYEDRLRRDSAAAGAGALPPLSQDRGALQRGQGRNRLLVAQGTQPGMPLRPAADVARRRRTRRSGGTGMAQNAIRRACSRRRIPLGHKHFRPDQARSGPLPDSMAGESNTVRLLLSNTKRCA